MALAIVYLSGPLGAAVYWVGPDGDDAAPGTEQQPWRSIQTAANRAQPGDVVRVRPGQYAERVTTVRGGLGNDRRIVFEAEGTAVMRGWVINHPYITVRGFDITGHTHSSAQEAYVRVNNGGSYFHLLSCTLRDGIAIKREDMVFLSPNRIESLTGGFIAAGFQPGQTISVMRGTNVALSNRASYVVTEVGDQALTVTGTAIITDGPKPTYITGSPNYGIWLGPGTVDCLLRGNRLTNLSYRYLFLQGFGHVVEANVFEQNNGWDLIYWTGTNHIVRSNLFRNLGWGVYEPSPDVFDNWPVRYENIQFTHNMVLKMIGVINAQKRTVTLSGPLYIRNNVFVDVGWLGIVLPNTVIEHNTFVRVAKQGNRLVQVERHPIIIYHDYHATNVVIRNNAFVDCGQATGRVTADQVGWYRFTGPVDTAVIGGNFVSGGPPDYLPKSTWPESPLLNGGDPGFVDLNDPLGPDGLPFTADDGLRPRHDSKLVGAGVGGFTIGAYAPLAVQPVGLAITWDPVAARVVVRWPKSTINWNLEAASNLSGPWQDMPFPVVLRDEYWEAAIKADQSWQYFRLRY